MFFAFYCIQLLFFQEVTQSVSFSATHLNYETKKIVFLKEKQETIGGIETYTKRGLKKTIGFKKLLDTPKALYVFMFFINDGKTCVFGDKLCLFLSYNKKGFTEIESFGLNTAQ